MIRRILLVTALLIVTFHASAFAVGVQPLVVDLTARPGDRVAFELILSPSDVQEVVNLVLYQPVQLITGNLTYQLGDAATFPAVDWVRLEADRVVVPPNEPRTVRGEISVPFDASGHHTVVVMVEPETDMSEGTIAIRIRYAVRVNLFIERPGLRPRAEIASFDLTSDEEGNPLLDLVLRNPTPVMYDAAAEVTIHDSERRLIQRVRLATEASRQSGREATRIYPGAEVQYTGVVTEPLFPGEYDVRLYVRYADGLQIVQRYPVTVEPGQFVQTERGNRLRLQPDRIAVTLRPGGISSQVIQIENRMQESYSLRFSARDIEPEYPRSVFAAVEMQLRAPSPELEPRRMVRPVLTLRTSRDADLAPGGYYGYVDVHVSQGETYVETYTVPIYVILDGPAHYAAEIIGVHTEAFEGEQTYTVEVRNTGDIHISPRGTLYLKDESGTILRTIPLVLQPGVDDILPNLSGLLIGSGVLVDPGVYTAEIRIIEQDQVIGTTEVPLHIETAEEEG